VDENELVAGGLSMEDLAQAGQEQKEAQATRGTEDVLSLLADLVDQLTDAEDQQADLEEKLKAAKEAVKLLSEVKIPNLLNERGLSEVRMADGRKVIVEEDLAASVSEANRKSAFDWLRSKNLGDIIKAQVITSFGQGEEEQAAALVEELQAKNIPVEYKEAIHASTLKAFCKEQIKADPLNFPMKLFGVFQFKKTKIKK